MNRLIFKSVIFLLIAMISSCIEEHDCDIDPVIENELIEDGFTIASNTNFISQLDPETIDEIIIGNESTTNDLFVKFNDIDSIEQYVKSARLKLYLKEINYSGTGPFSISVSAIDENWDENALSYSSKPSATYYSDKLFKADTLVDKKLFEIDVTNILNAQFEVDQLNFGFMLSLNQETNNSEIVTLSFHSSESENSAYWPAIDITYSDPAIPASDVPEVYFSVKSSSTTSKMAIYKGWYADGSDEAQLSTIRDGLSLEGYSPSICAEFDTNQGVYFLETVKLGQGIYQYILAKADSANDGEILNYFGHNDLDSILFLDNYNANTVYMAGSSDEGEVFILQASDGEPEILYRKSVTDETMNIVDMEETEGSYVLYWIETEEHSGKFRIMRYNYLTTYSQEVFNESDFDSGFSPKALTLSDNQMFIVGNTNTERGVFYAAESFGEKSVTKIDVTSSYKSNITDLKLDESGQYLYWMNYSENPVEGGIMRVKIAGGNSEVAYGNIAHGFSFEIPPYWLW